MERKEIISVKGVNKSFKGVQVLNNVNLAVYEKETLGIIGKSGVGKSLILKHIIGLMKADSGEILVDGVNVAEAGRGELEKVRSRMGFLFQNAALFDSMTVFENIALPLRETTKLSEKQIDDRVVDLLDHVGLEAARDKYPPQLSGGMKKRVGLARALVNNPDIILFDEPTTGLDPLRKNAVHELIAHSQRHHGFTAVIVSHEIPDIFNITDRIAMIDQGAIVVDVPTTEITKVKNPTFLNFISGAPSFQSPRAGLASRVEFEARVGEEHERSKRYGDPFTVVFLRLGIPQSDTLMEQWHLDLAHILRKKLRVADMIGRFDERCIAFILPGTTKEGATQLAGRIGGLVREALTRDDERLNPRLTYGYSEYEEKKTPEMMLQEAILELRA